MDEDGTENADRIIGSDLDDLLRGLGGADTLRGLAGDDTLIGGVGNDLVAAGLGDDSISGEAGADSLTGAGGDDRIEGGSEDDRLTGGVGDDTLVGGSGRDILTGGDGLDWASYEDATAAVIVDVAMPRNNFGFAAGDTYFSIENFLGSNFNDILRGSEIANILSGGRGHDVITGGNGADTLIGGRGEDTLDGGAGSDWVSYETAREGLTVDLGPAKPFDPRVANPSYAALDIVDLWVTAGMRFTGRYALLGELIPTRHELRDGGQGVAFQIDLIDIFGPNLAARDAAGGGDPNTGESMGDSFLSIENIRGSEFADNLRGDAAANGLSGGGGRDELIGRGGADTLIGGAGFDRFVIDATPDAADRIEDFTSGDKIAIEGARAALAIGAVAGSAFVQGSTAVDAGDRLIYDRATGRLFFDADGAGGDAQVLIATLANNAQLTAADFIVI